MPEKYVASKSDSKTSGAWVVLSSFKTTKEILASPFSLPAHWQFDNYAHAWTDAGIRQFFLNTV
ncbi:MAG TPA: hypothetical protein VF204_09435, partial [Streptosporangiaceae bacterium]